MRILISGGRVIDPASDTDHIADVVVDAGRIVREYVDVIEVVIPELKDMEGFLQHNPYHSYDVLEHCIRAMENIEIDDGGISDHQAEEGD